MEGIIYLVLIVASIVGYFVFNKMRFNLITKATTQDNQLSHDDNENLSALKILKNVCIGSLIFIVILIGFKVTAVIDAGETAVEIKFGKVLPGTLEEGFHFKNLFSTLSTYETRVQNKTFTLMDGSQIKAITKDRLEVNIDLTAFWKVDEKLVPNVYRKYAKTMKTVEKKFIVDNLRSFAYDECSKFDFKDLISSREEFASNTLSRFQKEYDPEGLMLLDIRPRTIEPVNKDLIHQIAQKLVKQEKLAGKDFELKTAEINADIRRAEANGLADAQKIIEKTLTDLYVRFEGIQAIKELAKSNNTTFMMIPMSTSAGVPSVVDLSTYMRKK